MKQRLSLITFLFIMSLSRLAAEQLDTLQLVKAARSQIGITVLYNGSYQALAYPLGDVPIESGVCTDVVIRALRTAWKWDLQKRVHEDMKSHFSAYPKNWNLRRPDKNIDHRRVPNLKTYFKRQGFQVPVSTHAKDYQPGDIVSCIVPPHLPHIMIVSDKKTSSGTPFVIHNIGLGTQEEDRLFDFKITGHYRFSIK